MTSDSRAQRLVDEFNQAATIGGGFNVAYGIAGVLEHIAETEYDLESWYAVPQQRLTALAAALTAPSLLDRALAGDAKAARLFLQQAGITDANGQLLPQYQTPQSTP